MDKYNHISFHRHELLVVYQDLQLELEGRPINLLSHQLVILPATVERRLSYADQKVNLQANPTSKYRHLADVISLSDQFLEIVTNMALATPEIMALFDRPQRLSYSQSNWTELCHLVQQTYSEQFWEPTPIHAKSLAARMAFILLEICHNQQLTNSQRIQFNERQDLAYQVQFYLDHHFKEALTVTDIANRFDVSPSTLNRVFQDYHHTTVYQYLLACRLHFAHQAIHHGATIADSWQTAGFGDYSNFYRAFVKHFGYRPHEVYKGK